MLITMYSEKPFELYLRSSFELPAWPYSTDPEDKSLFEKYMRELTVFRYDDSDTTIEGVNVSYPLNISLWDEPKIAPFKAYLNSVHVNGDFIPITWPGGELESESRFQKLRNHPITSDMLAWTNWNTLCEVEVYNPENIKRTILTEYLDQTLCHQGKCWVPDTTKVQ